MNVELYFFIRACFATPMKIRNRKSLSPGGYRKVLDVIGWLMDSHTAKQSS